MGRPGLSLLQGTVDVLVLRTLSFGPNHGFGIAGWIRARTDGELDIEDGALYQALHRLQRQGLIAAEWGVSENNRRARYYELTDEGRRRLRSEVAQWRRYAGAVSRVLEPA